MASAHKKKIKYIPVTTTEKKLQPLRVWTDLFTVPPRIPLQKHPSESRVDFLVFPQTTSTCYLQMWMLHFTGKAQTPNWAAADFRHWLQWKTATSCCGENRPSN